jgi:hypothetical protein
MGLRPNAPSATSLRVSLTLTLILLAIAGGVTGFAGWRGAQPPDFVRGPRMVPWRFVMLAAAALFMLLLIHLVTLLGVDRPRVI